MRAFVADYEPGCCEVTWTSSVEGVIGTSPTATYRFPTPGTRTLTATARDAGGATRSHSITIRLLNTVPKVEIVSPAATDALFAGLPVVLRGTAVDVNELAGIPCSSFLWVSNRASDHVANGGSFPVTGCHALVTFPDAGNRTLTLRVTDELGLSGTAQRAISVGDPPATGPPVVTIVDPPDRAVYAVGQGSTLVAEVFEPDGDDVTLTWYVTPTGGSEVVLGNGNHMQWIPSALIPGHCDLRGGTVRAVASDKDGAGEDRIIVFVAYPVC